MKIGILTFHASFNYGSMLQAYALHKVLTDMGHNVKIINFRSAEQREMYHYPIILASPKYSKVRMLLHYIRHFRSYYPQIRKWNRYNAFLKKYLVHTKEFHTVKELEDYHFQFDYLVIGSDQIWNYKCHDFSEAFWGNFCYNKIKKVAYAPSMGPYPEHLDVDYLKSHIVGFHAISVRELKEKKILTNNNIFSDVSLSLDPTLLLKESDYNTLTIDKPLIDGDYLFFYEPFIRPQYLKIALDVGERLGYRVIVDRQYDIDLFKEYKNLSFYTEVGPKEFINLIKFAKLVVAHSLHAILFSIIYRKDFYALDGDKDSRMNTILHLFGLEKRAINLDNPILLENEQIDYWDSIYVQYDLHKEKSLSFLENAIL